MGTVKKLLGTTNKAFVDRRGSTTVREAFFQPYKSPSEFAWKSASVVAAPIIYTVFTPIIAVIAAFEMLCAAANLVTGDTASAKENVVNALSSGALAFTTLFLAIVSPFINLVDLVGSGINTLLPDTPAHEPLRFN